VSEKIKYNRRRFLGIAAARVLMPKSFRASMSIETSRAALDTICRRKLRISPKLWSMSTFS